MTVFYGNLHVIFWLGLLFSTDDLTRKVESLFTPEKRPQKYFCWLEICVKNKY